jgi:hypothetical protein
VTLPWAASTPSTASTRACMDAGIGSRPSPIGVEVVSRLRTDASVPWVICPNRVVKVALMVSVST